MIKKFVIVLLSVMMLTACVSSDNGNDSVSSERETPVDTSKTVSSTISYPTKTEVITTTKPITTTTIGEMTTSPCIIYLG